MTEIVVNQLRQLVCVFPENLMIYLQDNISEFKPTRIAYLQPTHLLANLASVRISQGSSMIGSKKIPHERAQTEPLKKNGAPGQSESVFEVFTAAVAPKDNVPQLELHQARHEPGYCLSDIEEIVVATLVAAQNVDVFPLDVIILVSIH